MDIEANKHKARKETYNMVDIRYNNYSDFVANFESIVEKMKSYGMQFIHVNIFNINYYMSIDVCSEELSRTAEFALTSGRINSGMTGIHMLHAVNSMYFGKFEPSKAEKKTDNLTCGMYIRTNLVSVRKGDLDLRSKLKLNISVTDDCLTFNKDTVSKVITLRNQLIGGERIADSSNSNFTRVTTSVERVAGTNRNKDIITLRNSPETYEVLDEMMKAAKSKQNKEMH